MSIRKKISELPSVTAEGNGYVPIVQGGVTKRTTAQSIANLAKTGGVSGTFTTDDAKTVTVVDGIITAIV